MTAAAALLQWEHGRLTELPTGVILVTYTSASELQELVQDFKLTSFLPCMYILLDTLQQCAIQKYAELQECQYHHSTRNTYTAQTWVIYPLRRPTAVSQEAFQALRLARLRL